MAKLLDSLNQFYCQPCDHKWYQHRDPDPKMRRVGAALIAAGAIQVALAIAFLVGH